MLYSGCSKPLYKQLKESLMRKINSGEYLPKQALPGERVLMDQYGVSRITVRQAIAELVNEGVLIREHGKGTFVAEKRIEKPLARLLGIVEELTAEDLDVSVKALERGVISPAPEVSKELGLNLNEKVYGIKRLVTTGKLPLLIIEDYLPESLKYIVENCVLERDILYIQLEACGYFISRGRQKIRAEAATQEEAEILECKKGAPVLVVKRTTFGSGDMPIMYSRIVYKGDRYEYYVDLKRSLN